MFTTVCPRPLNREPLGFLFVSTIAATMVKSYSFNPLWTMNTTIFQQKSNLYHTLRPIIGRLFQKIILGRSLRSSFIDSFSFAKKRCNTAQGLGSIIFPFFPLSLFFFSFVFFMVTRDYDLNQLRIRFAYNFKFQRKRNGTPASCRKNFISVSLYSFSFRRHFRWLCYKTIGSCF